MEERGAGEIEKVRGRSGSMETPPTVSDLRLVLVGKTGTGKSSSGNTMLGREAFRASTRHSSETAECSKQRGKVFSRKVSVVDTPGLFDTFQSEEKVKREISKCINMSAPGPHAILLVVRIGLFSREERDAVMKVEEIFGEEAWKYSIILFTHGDVVEKSDFDEMLKEAGPDLKEILEKTGNRYHVFNNLRANNRRQVLGLLEKVEEMVQKNGGEFYSNATYETAVEMMGQKELELKQLYEERLKEEVEAVRKEYEQQLKEAREDKKKLEKRRQAELEELKRYYSALEKGVRHVVEQLAKDDDNRLLKKFHEVLKLN